MKALFELRVLALADGQWLAISPLHIELKAIDEQSWAEESNSDLALAELALSEYYSDSNNYINANEASVEKLIEQFWQMYDSNDRYDAALGFFGLPLSAQWADIKQAYRLKAAESHPDRGGNAARFIEAREHYLVLKAVRRR